MSTIYGYISAIIVLILAILIVKKVAGCLFKTVISVITIGVLVALYYYFKQ
ncbi:hypothetical protein [Xylanibacter oryzae]|uniref:hypothetical protein n=1 Tax=Xylanibacter oryzae TaxID=185293 RepID=UPI0004BBD1DC|nr:hypothetical protein [Xylanibacter oryzae]